MFATKEAFPMSNRRQSEISKVGLKVMDMKPNHLNTKQKDSMAMNRRLKESTKERYNSNSPRVMQAPRVMTDEEYQAFIRRHTKNISMLHDPMRRYPEEYNGQTKQNFISPTEATKAF